jgi:hypothetical protein
VVGDGVETCGDERRGGAFVKGAVEGGEKVVDVAVEGCNAEGVRAVFEEEGVDEWTMLWWVLVEIRGLSRMSRLTT